MLELMVKRFGWDKTSFEPTNQNFKKNLKIVDPSKVLKLKIPV